MTPPATWLSRRRKRPTRSSRTWRKRCSRGSASFRTLSGKLANKASMGALLKLSRPREDFSNAATRAFPTSVLELPETHSEDSLESGDRLREHDVEPEPGVVRGSISLCPEPGLPIGVASHPSSTVAGQAEMQTVNRKAA